MRPIKELVESLENGIASPVARHLAYCIRTKNRIEAGKIIAGEGFSDPEERKALMDHFEKEWSCKSMTFVRVTKKEDVKYVDFTDGSVEQDRPEYLVRIGTMVFISSAWKLRSYRDFTFRDASSNQYTFDQLDEVLEIVLE